MPATFQKKPLVWVHIALFAPPSVTRERQTQHVVFAKVQIICEKAIAQSKYLNTKLKIKGYRLISN